jgi:hypothetical protein
LLCPPVLGEHEREGRNLELFAQESPDSAVREGNLANKQEVNLPNSRSSTMKDSFASWASKWGYASSHRATPAGYRKPIPFEHVLFSTLDSKISFDPENEKSSAHSTHDSVELIPNPPVDAEMHHRRDMAITHDTASKIVVPHHPLRAWEDIPPYPRSRGYGDQPAYTDDYDDFLWLPRDPLSTLDLDDTVEMRLSLTTSAGGSGRISDWPPVVDNSDTASSRYKHEHDNDEGWQEVMTRLHLLHGYLQLRPLLRVNDS